MRIQNLRCHEDTTIDLDKVNIFVGPNGAGKTTIRAALEFALTGRCHWANGGRPSDLLKLIRSGAESASVELDIEGLGRITRSIPHDLAVEGWEGTAAKLQKQIYEKLGCTEQTIRAVLDTHRFIDMSPAEQQTMLFALMGLDFTRDTIRAEIDESALDVFDQICPAELPEGAQAFDLLEKKARDARRVAKKALADIAYEDLPQLPDGVRPTDIVRAREQLRQLRQLRNNKAQELGAAKQLVVQQEQAQKEIARLEAEAEQAENELTGISNSAESRVAMEKQIAELDQQIARVEGLDAEIKGLQPEKTRLQDIIASLQDDTMQCPLIDEACKMTKVQRRKLEETLRRQLEELENKLAVLENERQALPLDDLQVQRQKVLAAKAELDKAGSRAEALTLIITQGKERIEREKARLENAPDVEGLEKEIAALDERIERGEKLIQSLDEYARVEERNAKVKQKADRLTGEIAALDYLVKALGAGEESIRKRLLTDVLGTVQERARERLKTLTAGQYSISLNADPVLEILVHCPGGYTVPLPLLSTSERMRVGIVLQDALALLAGLKILVIDDGETLDVENRKLLSRMLVSLKDEYDTILVFAALGETPPRPSAIPGMSVFCVESGRVNKLEAEAAA